MSNECFISSWRAEAAPHGLYPSPPLWGAKEKGDGTEQTIE